MGADPDNFVSKLVGGEVRLPTMGGDYGSADNC
jgi:hypothetical protein